MESKLSVLFKKNLSPEVRNLPLPIVKTMLIQLLKVSPHRATKILKDPAKVTNVELIMISKKLEISCWELIEDYGVGKEGVEELLKEYHFNRWQEKQAIRA